jgi:hypothetical protein
MSGAGEVFLKKVQCMKSRNKTLITIKNRSDLILILLITGVGRN